MSTDLHDDTSRSLGSESSDRKGDIFAARSGDIPPLPPDGGYGWIVLIASFTCNLLIDGMGYSIGILNVHFLHTYGETKSKTAWIGSIQTGYGFVGKWPYESFVISGLTVLYNEQHYAANRSTDSARSEYCLK